jgi:hypothetical protein
LGAGKSFSRLEMSFQPKSTSACRFSGVSPTR